MVVVYHLRSALGEFSASFGIAYGEDLGSCPCNLGHADTVRLMTPHYA